MAFHSHCQHWNSCPQNKGCDDVCLNGPQNGWNFSQHRYFSSCFPQSTLHFAKMFDVVSPTMIFLISQLSTLTKKICPPSELLTRSTKCSFALRTSTGTNRDICGICKGPFHFPYQLQSYQRTVSPSGFVDSIHMMNLRQTRTYDMDTIDIYIYNIYNIDIYII